MITFNNSLDISIQTIKNWSQKTLLTEVTVIRDVYGKISFLFNNVQSIPDVEKEALNGIISQSIGDFLVGGYTGQNYHITKGKKKTE